MNITAYPFGGLGRDSLPGILILVVAATRLDLRSLFSSRLVKCVAAQLHCGVGAGGGVEAEAVALPEAELVPVVRPPLVFTMVATEEFFEGFLEGDCAQEGREQRTKEGDEVRRK